MIGLLKADSSMRNATLREVFLGGRRHAAPEGDAPRGWRDSDKFPCVKLETKGCLSDASRWDGAGGWLQRRVVAAIVCCSWCRPARYLPVKPTNRSRSTNETVQYRTDQKEESARCFDNTSRRSTTC